MNHTIDLIIAVAGVVLSVISLIRLFHLSYLETIFRRFFLLIFGVVGLAGYDRKGQIITGAESICTG